MAWVFQATADKRKHGDKAAWSAGWIDPEGKRKSKKFSTKSRAESHARKVEGQIEAGTYDSTSKKTWAEFRKVYEAKIKAKLTDSSVQITKHSLDHFERIVKPVYVNRITSRSISDYVSTRAAERRHRDDAESPVVSPATVNRELRTIRAALRFAHRLGYLARVPAFSDEFLREPGKLPTYVPPEHFAALYAACDEATLPKGPGISTADWWRALLVMAYMTGWRLKALVRLKRANVDLERGTALSAAADNKGKRDALVPLHPLVVEHLRKIPGFSVEMFPWPHGGKATYDRKGLLRQFHRIGRKAGVAPSHGKPRYGFHDLRRAFATMNADRMTGDALQLLMQHRDYQTTQRYINMARQLNPTVGNLYVPELPTIKVAT